MASSVSKAAESFGRGRGAFIVLEGLDRSGKSTQCERICAWLEGRGLKAKSLRFPDRSSPTGKLINDYLANNVAIDDAEIHKLFAQNRMEKRELMEQLLAEKTTLIVDRYSFSGVAFSSANGLDPQWCKDFELSLPAPDLVLYLHISPEEASARGGYGGERYERLEFQKKVETEYMKLQDSTWQIVNARQSPEDVTRVIVQHVESVLEKCLQDGPPIQRLWGESHPK